MEWCFFRHVSSDQTCHCHCWFYYDETDGTHVVLQFLFVKFVKGLYSNFYLALGIWLAWKKMTHPGLLLTANLVVVPVNFNVALIFYQLRFDGMEFEHFLHLQCCFWFSSTDIRKKIHHMVSSTSRRGNWWICLEVTCPYFVWIQEISIQLQEVFMRWLRLSLSIC